MIKPQIFRQYDIRGVVGRDLDAEVARAVGRAYGTLLARRLDTHDLTIALGRDNRRSSEELAAAVRDGLVACGHHVVDVGTVPTPVLYFAGAHLQTDGAMQVTGSHNPPEYNGFKMSIRGGSLYGEAIQDLHRIIDAEDYESGEGSVEERSDILDIYVDSIASRFEISRPIELVVDCGNGTGSVVAEKLLRALGSHVEVVPLFCESDGRFPNHHPDPVVDANLQDLIEQVRATGADVGIAFDGDADRIGAVDDRGRIVRGDTLLLLYALDLIRRRGPGQKVVFDVKCSQALPETVEKAGGVPIMSATGHSLIKQRMKDERALLAGELSGHIMFADDYYGFDDALYAACLLASIVASEERPLSERLDELPRFVSTAEIRYPTSEETKFEIVKRAVAHFSAVRDVISVDGARVLFGDGWGLIRASNTEPVLVARYEAHNEERLAEIREEMESWLREEGIEV